MANVPVSCPPIVAVAGIESDLVASIEALLAAREITGEADATRPDCPTLHATITRRDGHLVIAIERAGQAPIERTVDDPATAATVIESWTRRDLGSPLLGVRSVWHRVAAVAPREPAAIVAVDEPERAPAITTTHGIQLFAAAETAYASDHTLWAGLQVGASVGIGPVCGAVRLRADNVASAPSSFGGFDRSNHELLVGLDVPIAIGRVRFTPGFGTGLGVMHTHVEASQIGGLTGGLRADVHVTLTIPITTNLAIDLGVSGDLTQATHIETTTTMELPPEPRGIAHVAVGLRYGKP